MSRERFQLIVFRFATNIHFGLEYGLITCWRLKVKVTVTSQHPFVVHNSRVDMLDVTIIYKNVRRLQASGVMDAYLIGLFSSCQRNNLTF